MPHIKSKVPSKVMANAWAISRHVGVREGMHKPKPVIASAAKQSILVSESRTYGSPRRCAPRDDGLMKSVTKPFAEAASLKEIFL